MVCIADKLHVSKAFQKGLRAAPTSSVSTTAIVQLPNILSVIGSRHTSTSPRWRGSREIAVKIAVTGVCSPSRN